MKRITFNLKSGLLCLGVVAVMFIVATVVISEFWSTPEQRGQRLMEQGEFTAAAAEFEDPLRKGIAWFRAGEFRKSQQAFAALSTAEAAYNSANCLMMQGKYEDAVEKYDAALRQRPGWMDAEINRRIATVRAERVKSEGDDMGDQQIGADEIRFDGKKDNEGQETEVAGEQPLDSPSMQAMWLRRVQTRPADFLKTKFAYQNSMRDRSPDTETGRSTETP